jgi:hypothetical protein
VDTLKLRWLQVGVTWALHLVQEPAEPATSFYQAQGRRVLVLPAIDGAAAFIDKLRIISETVVPTLPEGAKLGRSIKPTSVANQSRRKTFRKGQIFDQILHFSDQLAGPTNRSKICDQSVKARSGSAGRKKPESVSKPIQTSHSTIQYELRDVDQFHRQVAQEAYSWLVNLVNMMQQLSGLRFMEQFDEVLIGFRF